MFHTRIIGLIAVLAVVVPASVADAKTRQYSSEIVSSPLSTADGYPGTGGSAYLSGTLESSELGTGAILDHVTMTGQPFGAPVLTFEGTEVFASARGMLENNLTGYSMARDDGSVDVFIKGRVTGGTRRYRDATGKYKYTGTI